MDDKKAQHNRFHDCFPSRFRSAESGLKGEEAMLRITP